MPAPTFSINPLTVTCSRVLPPLAKDVYGIYAAHRNNQTGLAWPHRKTVANMLGIHPDSVTRANRILETEGFIERQQMGGGSNLPNCWHIPQTWKDTPPRPNGLDPSTKRSAAYKEGNRQNEQKTTPTPSVADPQGEGDFVFQGKEPVYVRPPSSPWEITPEPIPTYQVTEEVVEHFTLDTLPAEIKALDRPEQLNPVVLLPILVSLLGVAPDLAQALLDELSGRLACQSLKAIDSPISYFRYLVREVRAGRFEVRYGADIAAARRAREAHQARLEGSSPPPPTITPDRQPESKMSADELRAMMRQALRGGAA